MKKIIKNLSNTVFALGVVSFFSDISSEMIYPILPIFLTSILGASPLIIGLLEGIAESTSAIVKIFSGILSDHTLHRKPWVMAGYSLAGFVKPLIAFTSNWHEVLGVRFLDRAGKGIRSAPRDALIADVTDEKFRGKAFGFHRAMDHAGAVIGPLLAAGYLLLPGSTYRKLFLLAAIPAFLAALFLYFGVHEKDHPHHPHHTVKFEIRALFGEFQADFRWFLLAVFLFTLGNSSDVFLLIRLSQAGITARGIAVLWSVHHVIKMIANYYGGHFSDKAGFRKMIALGWIWYAVIYYGFSITHSTQVLIGLFLLYGIYYGFVEPSEKAFIASLVPRSHRGRAYGLYHFVMGVGLFPASFMFGWVIQKYGVSVAFYMGAIFALLGCFTLWISFLNRIEDLKV